MHAEGLYHGFVLFIVTSLSFDGPYGCLTRLTKVMESEALMAWGRPTAPDEARPLLIYNVYTSR